MPTITITLQGHLLVAGGQAADLGIDLTIARRFDGGKLAPYIPATAVRGAVRIQLEALLRGDRQSATSPYPTSPTPAAPGPTDPVARLFGYSGPLRSRSQAREGVLRFGDALPVDAATAASSLTVRPGLEIDDSTGSATTGKLFFREVVDLAAEPLVFRAPVWIWDAADADDDEEHRAERERDIALLRAAVATTDALGAGKSKGGGSIAIAWSDEPWIPGKKTLPDDTTATKSEAAPKTPPRQDMADSATRARLVLTLQEPAHFGDGGPRGNHHATRTYIPGSTLRGAIAWALLRAKILTPDSPEFFALFLDPAAPVRFGDALLTSDPEVTPTVRPATLRHRRGRSEDLDDSLVVELARERVNRLLAGRHLYVRADDGADRFDPARTRPEDGIVRRTRTRVSIDRWNGAAANGRLFSIEQIEPWRFDEASLCPCGVSETTATDAPPARFVSTVELASTTRPSPLRHLALLAGVPLLVGAGRNHGLGLVEVEVCFEREPADAESAHTVRLLRLSEEVDHLAASLARRAGCLLPAAATLPVALVATSDYLPSSDQVRHPLAEPALGALGLADNPPARRFLNPGASGGYDQIPGHAPLKDLLPAIGAGSVFAYEIEQRHLSAFVQHLPALGRGVGSRVESGCGRFAVFEPQPRKER